MTGHIIGLLDFAERQSAAKLTSDDQNIWVLCSKNHRLKLVLANIKDAEVSLHGVVKTES